MSEAGGLDVFVSFCEEDDVPLEEEGYGCVALVCDAIEEFGNIYLGRDIRIGLSDPLPSLRVDEGRTAPLFGPHVGPGDPREAACFVAILSPHYVRPGAVSTKRQVEAERFANGPGGDRLFSVVREPVPDAAVLPSLRDAPTYHLFDESGRPTLTASIARLTRSLCEALLDPDGSAADGGGRKGERARAATYRGRGPAADSAAAAARTVFLAHAGPSLEPSRQELRAELLRRGHRVVPEAAPPADAARAASEAEDALAGADLSVHLFGDRYDEIAHRECTIAGRAGPEGARRLVWIGAADPDPRLHELFEEVEGAPAGTEPFRGISLEAFKSSVLEAVERGDRSAAGAEPAPEGRSGVMPLVYLLFDRVDEKWVLRLQRFLGRRCIVRTPLFEGSAREIDEHHEEWLRRCDGVLVVWGGAPQKWWKELENYWFHLDRRWRPDDDVPKAFYLVDPLTAGKQMVGDPGARVIRAGEQFARGDLSEFLAELGVHVEPAGDEGAS